MADGEVSGVFRADQDEDILDAFRSGENVTLNCFGALYELTPSEAEELGTQLIYAAARARGK